jgi:deoxyribodipyrimidine photo-lyase
MCECIDDLNDEIKKFNSTLIIYNDDPAKVINLLLKSDDDINCVCMNKDYSPFAKKRETSIISVCNKYDVEFISMDDYMLTDNNILKDDDTIYVKFTPFHNRAKKEHVREPITNLNKKLYSKLSKKKILSEYKSEYKGDIHDFYETKEDYTPYIKGGRSECMKIINKIEKFKNYSKIRDFPEIETTHLSAYLKFNVISIRELYYIISKKISKDNGLITQFYWRDFYMMIMDKYPHVIGHPMKEKYEIDWDKNPIFLKKWKNGLTGFPIVDAGMRQLNKTGWMHGRPRMIVSNFLVKLVHIDWMEGEKYFAQNLLDYDIALNNGNWQWSSSTGADSQPYFRIFNPWRQSEKFDKNCDYIKKWIPELENVPIKDIHKWETEYVKYQDINYPKPILDVKKETKKAIQMYKNII